MLEKILDKLPYSHPFLFVDKLTHVGENGVEGTYTFNEDLEFYSGHFKDFPVTPGVILTECCAQIGVVCLGIFLLEAEFSPNKEISTSMALSSSEMEFYKPVLPGETVKVVSETVYFRFNKLKCSVRMYNTKEELVCKGLLAGMLKTVENGK